MHRSTPTLSLQRALLAWTGAALVAVGCSTRGGPSEHNSSPGPVAGGSAVARPLPLSTVTEGLRPEHLRQPPLLEKVAHIPASERGAPGTTSSSRVYDDGSFYLLAGQAPGSPGAARWTYLFRVEPEGVRQLRALFERVCAAADSLRPDDLGRVEYHVSTKSCTRTFVNGLPSDQSPVRAADGIINANSGTIERSP